jgi:hypothetical protein
VVEALRRVRAWSAHRLLQVLRLLITAVRIHLLPNRSTVVRILLPSHNKVVLILLLNHSTLQQPLGR